MYKLKNNQNEYLNNLFTTFAEFDKESIRLVNSETLKDFHNSLKSCMKIDRRCTVLFIKKYGNKLPDDYLYFAKCFINKEISD